MWHFSDLKCIYCALVGAIKDSVQTDCLNFGETYSSIIIPLLGRSGTTSTQCRFAFNDAEDKNPFTYFVQIFPKAHFQYQVLMYSFTRSDRRCIIYSSSKISTKTVAVHSLSHTMLQIYTCSNSSFSIVHNVMSKHYKSKLHK